MEPKACGRDDLQFQREGPRAHLQKILPIIRYVWFQAEAFILINTQAKSKLSLVRKILDNAVYTITEAFMLSSPSR